MGVTVSEFTGVLEDYVDYQTIGLEPLQVCQAVLDEIYEVDLEARRKRPEPNLATTAGTAEIAFASIAADVRKVIGIYQPGYTTSLSDYGRKPVEDFDQRDPRRRVYDDDWIVLNEQRKIVFNGDPGTTSTKWKADYYITAPVLALGGTIPLLDDSWVYNMFLPGCIGMYELAKNGEYGPQRKTFEAGLLRYLDRVRTTEDLRKHNAERGLYARRVVRPL